MSGRFRIDPRGPAPDRPVPPPPAPVAAKPGAPASTVAPLTPRPPAPTPPRPAMAAAPAPKRNRRALVIGALVITLLLVGGGVAIYAATALTYPDKYVLKEREYPSGMSKARLSQSEMDEIGIDSNPGDVDMDANDATSSMSEDPRRAHALVLTTSSGSDVVIMIMQYEDKDQAIAAAREARAICTFAGGSVLRDDDVLVVVVAQGAPRSAVAAVRDALKEKTSDLATVCG